MIKIESSNLDNLQRLLTVFYLFLLNHLQKVGCDWKLHSNAIDDECGICNGKGKSCKIINGTMIFNLEGKISH